MTQGKNIAKSEKQTVVITIPPNIYPEIETRVHNPSFMQAAEEFSEELGINWITPILNEIKAQTTIEFIHLDFTIWNGGE